MRKLVDRIDEQLSESMKKMVKEGIDVHPKMIKLVQFYEDEMGSEMSVALSDGDADPQRRTKNSSRRTKTKSQPEIFS